MEKAFRETPNTPGKILGFKKSLRSVRRKKTENTMVKCKKTKGETMIYKI
jgi:hypothetical protein